MSTSLAHEGYHHEAFFYAGEAEFMAGTLGFLLAGYTAQEPTLVVLAADKIRALRGALGSAGDDVLFADMGEVGANPARIIPAWQDFLAVHGRAGRRLRGIGEPISSARSAAELSECQRHEALLNVAFVDCVPGFWLMCPYDTTALAGAVLDEARRNHPYLSDATGDALSPAYPGDDVLAAPFAEPLPAPLTAPWSFDFATGGLAAVRAFVSSRAAEVGLDGMRVADLVLAVDEIAANSIRHGHGGGHLSMWVEPGAVVCEVRDRGRLTDPLADRTRVSAGTESGRGLWLANQLCDLVQVRTFADGTVVRLHLRTTG